MIRLANAAIRTLIYSPISLVILDLVGWYEFLTWDLRGRKIPMPRFIKQKHVLSYAQKYHLKTFVETGTYLGEMVDKTKDLFNQIYTVEIDESLFKRAKRKFSNDKRIKVLKGDSATVLPIILTKFDGPALFWLDAYDSKGITSMSDSVTPIFKELKSIFSSKRKGDVVLIDDADAIFGREGYPSFQKIKKDVLNNNSKLKIVQKDNVIVIHP